MVITKFFKQGLPADDAEITEASTFNQKMDGANAAVCQEDRIEVIGETVKCYDFKQLFSYAAGVWELILTNDRDTSLIQLKIIVTNAAGAQQRIIHDFGQVSFTGAADVTFTSPSKAQQDLLATERLAVIITQDQNNQIRYAIGNFSTACDSRLLTPDEAAAGAAPYKPLIINADATI